MKNYKFYPLLYAALCKKPVEESEKLVIKSYVMENASDYPLLAASLCRKQAKEGLLHHKTGLVSFRGKIKNGKPDGIATHYNEFPGNLYTPFDTSDFGKLGDNWVKFFGVFTEGVRNGKGTLYLTNGEKVEGSW
jgi:hypothetical protein